MLIHSFVTDGYYDFAVSLLESFKMQHGDHMPFLLHTKDLSEKQILGLKNTYKELTIKNSSIDWEWLIERSNMTKQRLLRGKQEVEKIGTRYVSREFYHWKHYISIYSRYRDAILDAFDFAGDEEHILHLDVDLYINRPIDTIFNLIKLADVSLLLRPSYSPEWRRMYGCIMGFTVNKASRKFMQGVRTHIDAVDFINIPKGYGQIVFWRAYNDFKKDSGIKFAQIPKGWIYKGFNNKAFILSANNGSPKHATAKRYNQRNSERINNAK